jgi:hypothetical protein
VQYAALSKVDLAPGVDQRKLARSIGGWTIPGWRQRGKIIRDAGPLVGENVLDLK